MKLNTECMRDVMLKIESLNYGSNPRMDELHKMLPDYSVEELNYTCLKLSEANYIDIIATDIDFGAYKEVLNVKEITFRGHQFIEDIRSDSVWQKTKETAKNIGSFSVHVLTEIAKSVVLQAIKSQM